MPSGTPLPGFQSARRCWGTDRDSTLAARWCVVGFGQLLLVGLRIRVPPGRRYQMTVVTVLVGGSSGPCMLAGLVDLLCIGLAWRHVEETNLGLTGCWFVDICACQAGTAASASRSPVVG